MKEEDLDLIIRAQDGDPIAKDQIYRKFERAGWKIARKWQNSLRIPLEDLFQIAMLGLTHAMYNFNVEKAVEGEIELSTYFFKCMYGALYKERRKYSLQKRDGTFDNLSLDLPIFEDNETRTLMDLLATESFEDAIVDSISTREPIRYALMSPDLSPGQRKILETCVKQIVETEELAVKRVAEALSVSPSYVRNTLKTIKSKLEKGGYTYETIS